MPNQLAKTVADRIVSFICRHGIPEQILSDQGTDFQSVLISELFELLDIHRHRTSPFHPQTDGLSERTIRTVKQMIKAFIIDHPEQHNKWDKQLEKTNNLPTILQSTRLHTSHRSVRTEDSNPAYPQTL